MRPELEELISEAEKEAESKGICLSDNFVRNRLRAVLDDVDQRRLGKEPIISVKILECADGPLWVKGDKSVEETKGHPFYSEGFWTRERWAVPNINTPLPDRNAMSLFRKHFLSLMPDNRDLRRVLADKFRNHGFAGLIAAIENSLTAKERIKAHARAILMPLHKAYRGNFFREFSLYQKCTLLKDLSELVESMSVEIS